jgi:hypothetical protein
MPERIQQKRTAGWRKPENTVSVARPSRWGNPFRITHEECDQMNDDGMCWVVRHVERPSLAHESTQTEARATAVSEFRLWLTNGRLLYGVGEVRAQLRGKNLMVLLPTRPALPRGRPARDRKREPRGWGYVMAKRLDNPLQTPPTWQERIAAVLMDAEYGTDRNTWRPDPHIDMVRLDPSYFLVAKHLAAAAALIESGVLGAEPIGSESS